MSGPLKGITIVEFAGIGPGPFCGMILADLGAEIIRIDRSSQHGRGNTIDFQHRSKLSLSADLKNPNTVNEIKKLIDDEKMFVNSNSKKIFYDFSIDEELIWIDGVSIEHMDLICNSIYDLTQKFHS